MNDQLMLERLAETDVCPAQAPLPREAWSRDVALAEIERRVGMQTRERTEQMVPEYRTSRGWLVAAAAFIVVLVVGTATLFWLTRGGGPEIIDEPTTTLAPTTTAPTTTTAPPSPLSLPDTWQRVGASVMTPIVGIFDMVETPSGLVAVGFDPGEEDMRQNGVILTSADGVTWSRLAEDDPALNLGAILMYGVTDGGPGIVAVGMGCEDDLEGCVPYPTVWTSADGSSWDRSAADPDVFGDRGALLDVVATEHGLIAAGGFYTTEGETELIQPTVWLSPDGIEWEQVWQGEAYDFTTAPVITGFQALAADAIGTVVGVGPAVNDQGDFVGAIWTSTNGREWERIDQNSPVFASGTDAYVAIQDVGAGPGGFVAVGTDGGTEVAIWHSPDGFAWNRADTSNQPFEYIGTLSSVDALDTGWIAAGPHGFADPVGGTVTLWISPDGLNWDRVHSIDPGYATSVVAIESGIAVAGAMAGVDNYYAAVWAGPTFDPAVPPPDPGPTPPPEPEITAPEEGLSCEELIDVGLDYMEAVAYWVFYERPSDLDPDGTGAPCAANFSTEEVEQILGPAEKLNVEIVADYATGTFSATGPGVDEDAVCPAGNVEFVGDAEPHPAAMWRWEDLYTCDDGSGTFLLRANEFYEDGQHVAGVWDISSGTDGHVSLTGGGGVNTVYTEDQSVIIGWVWPAAGEN